VPPAPFEGALLLHDHFVKRGIRGSVEIRTVGPIAAPVPITKEVSQRILDALTERGIEYVPNQHVVELDTRNSEARLANGGSIPYDDLFVGIPVHRAPHAVESSGLAVDGWVPVEKTNLATRFPDVYAVGDITALPMAKAGVFAEAAARVVADDIAARLRGGVLERPYEGAGTCYIEFGGGWSAWSRPTSSADRRPRRGSWGRPESSPSTSRRSRRHGESAGSYRDRVELQTRDPIEAPDPWDSLQLVLAAIDELDPRTCDEILHRARHEYFARSGEPGNACTRVDGDSGDLVADQLALARMEACPDLESERLCYVADGAGAADRPRRPSKMAKNPSPAVSISRPRKRPSSRRTTR
jgi:Pyridine nucleotide-disulphide oxidoreductase